MITVAVEGADALAQRLAGFPARAQQRVGALMTRLGLELQARVVDNLSGAVLHRRSGRLAAAQSVVVSEDAAGASVSVGFDAGDVPYGAIQEFGGATRAHLIAAKNTRALAFSLRDRLVFAKRVNHPGSVIPARSFLRAALAEMAPAALDEVAAGVRDAIDA